VVKALQIGLPIANILPKETVNHMFPQDQVRQEHVRTSIEKARWNKICLVYRWARIALTDHA
jgi:hypothetical protein